MKACVVLRKLPNHETVASAVILEPSTTSADHSFNLGSYFESMALSHKESICNEFIEFKEAIWKRTILEVL